MDRQGKRCSHPRLARIEIAGTSLPMYGNVFQCEACKALVEVVIGRAITAQELREFADAIESGKAKPSVSPEPLDEIEIEAVEDED
jgi:hypothetical protein